MSSSHVPATETLADQKLRAEIEQLRSPFWKKPEYVAALVPIVLTVAALAAGVKTGYFEAQYSEREAKRLMAEAEKTKAEAEKTTLDTEVRQLRAEAERLRTNGQALVRALGEGEQTIQAVIDLKEKDIDRAIQAIRQGPGPQDQRETVEGHLKAAGEKLADVSTSVRAARQALDKASRDFASQPSR